MTLNAMMVPAVSGGVSPLTIYPGQVPWWVHVGLGRVMGTPPKIEALTNMAVPSNGNIAQPNAVYQPPLIGVDGKDYAHVSTDVANVFWDATPLGTNFWEVGATDLTLYWVGSFDDFSAFRFLFDLGVTNQTGISIWVLTSNRVRVIVHAGGSTGYAEYGSVATDGPQFWRARYDSSDITLQRNGSQVASAAKTGTMSNACTGISVGDQLGASNSYADSRLRTAALIVGATTAAQDAEMLAWGLAEV